MKNSRTVIQSWVISPSKMKGFAALSFHRANFLDSWFPTGKRKPTTQTPDVLTCVFMGSQMLFHPIKGTNLLGKAPGYSWILCWILKNHLQLGYGLSQKFMTTKISTRTSPPKLYESPSPKTKTTVKFDQDFPITISFSFDHGTSAKFGKSLRSPRHHKRTACRKSVDRGMVNWWTIVSMSVLEQTWFLSANTWREKMGNVRS